MGIYNVEASKTAKLKKAYVVNKDQKLEKLKKTYVVNKDQKLEKLWSGFTPKFVSHLSNSYVDQINKKGLVDSYSSARGNNLVGYSEDGINWRYRQTGLLDTTIHGSLSRYKNSIACGNEVTVILAGYGKIQYSEDCVNWTEVVVDSSSNIGVRGIINFCDGMFIFMTSDTNSTYVTNVYTSTNGKTWTKKGTIPKLANYIPFGYRLVTNIVPYTYNGTKGYLCAINNPDGNIYDYLFFSTNLITWTKLSTAISAMYIREIYVVRGDVRIIGYAEGNLGIYYGSRIDGKNVQYPPVRLNYSDDKFGEYLSSVVVGEGDKESILIYAQNSNYSRKLFVIDYFSLGWSEDPQSVYIYDGYTSNSQRMVGPGYGDGKCVFLVWNDDYNTSTVSSYIMPYDESTGNLSNGTRTELHQGPHGNRMAKILYTK